MHAHIISRMPAYFNDYTTLLFICTWGKYYSLFYQHDHKSIVLLEYIDVWHAKLDFYPYCNNLPIMLALCLMLQFQVPLIAKNRLIG